MSHRSLTPRSNTRGYWDEYAEARACLPYGG